MYAALFGVMALDHVCSKAQADPLTKPLPPNWEAGGTAKTQKRPRRALTTMPTEIDASSDALLSTGDSASTRRIQVGLAASFPELLRVEASYKIARNWGFGFSAGPGWPWKITVEMPSDVIKSDNSNTLAVAYTAFTANFDATWGPHATALGAWYPFGGAFHVYSGVGFRQLKLQGSAESQLRVCTIDEARKEPPCPNDAAAIQTRNRLQVRADAVMDSWLLAAGTGWHWRPAERWGVSLGLGILRPIKTKTSVNVAASIVEPDGTPQDLTGALAELKAKSEQDVKEKATSELENFATMTLPSLSFGIGYLF